MPRSKAVTKREADVRPPPVETKVKGTGKVSSKNKGRFLPRKRRL